MNFYASAPKGNTEEQEKELNGYEDLFSDEVNIA